jgi:uncharacterized protein YsxB (DUF464 family)
MTTVKFFKGENNFFTKLEVSGHTNFGNYGTDTLCATISGIVQAGALGINKVVKAQAKIVKNDDDGYLLIELPNGVSESVLEKTQIVFETMYEALRDLKSGYSKFINLEVK